MWLMRDTEYDEVEPSDYDNLTVIKWSKKQLENALMPVRKEPDDVEGGGGGSDL